MFVSEKFLKTYNDMGLLQQIDDNENLYTTEKGKVVKYDHNGNKIAEYGKQKFRGGVGTFFQHATSVIVDSNELIFATGGDYGPINIIDEDGNFAGIGGYGTNEKSYGSPRGIALDSENTAYITDYSRNKILVFEKTILNESEPEQQVLPEPEAIPEVEEVVPEEEGVSQPLCGKGTILKDGICVVEEKSEGGGCLIATAAFGSEMSPQIQFLREIRDNTVLQTESGSAFMTGFNQFYYSFSPAIADYERENPAFKEVVKLTLTPLLTSLTLLQYADIDSESEMLGYGIGIILLNIGGYFVAPIVLIITVRKNLARLG